MPKRLTNRQIQAYDEQGFVSPISVLSADEVAQLRAGLERVEAVTNRKLAFPQISKSYLL